MKRLMIAGTVLAVISVMGWLCGFIAQRRATQKEWPVKQLTSAVTLARGLAAYRDAHGGYPERLSDLVAGGAISADQFERLRFRSSAGAQPQEWLYRRPESIDDVAIVAPDWMYPWPGHLGCRPMAWANGGGELVLRLKERTIPRWVAR